MCRPDPEHQFTGAIAFEVEVESGRTRGAGARAPEHQFFGHSVTRHRRLRLRVGSREEDWRSRGPQVDGGGGAAEGPRMEACRKVRETPSERRAREAPRDFVNACVVWPREGASRVCGGGNMAGPDWFRSPVITAGSCPGQPNGPKMLPSMAHAPCWVVPLTDQNNKLMPG